MEFWSNWYINYRCHVTVVTEHSIGPSTTEVLASSITSITSGVFNSVVNVCRVSKAHVTATPAVVLEGEVGVISTGKTASLWFITVLLWSIVEIS